MTPDEVRRICTQQDSSRAAAALEKAGLNARTLGSVLGGARSGTYELLGEHVVEFTDGLGRHSTMSVYVPDFPHSGRLGLIVGLHGVGGSGAALVSQLTTLADACGAVLVCPSAPAQVEGTSNFDMAGIFGPRFGADRWTYGREDAPMAALYWALANLPVDSNRCAVVGVSMGGIAAWNLALRRSGRWSVAVSINGAPSLWELFGPDGQLDALMPNLLAIPITVLHGTDDRQIPARLDRDAVDRLRRMGHESVAHVEVEGGEHSLESMALEPGSLQLATLVDSIGRGSRNPWPRTVEHRATTDDGERMLWVSMAGVMPGQTARVRADVVGRDRIDVVAENVEHVTLHLSERLVEPGPVHVSVNSVLHRVEFKPRLQAMVTSYVSARQDIELMAQDTVDIDIDTSTRNEAAHA